VLLVAVAFLDELGSGVPFVGAPEIQRAFGVSYGQAAGWLIFAMTAAATAIEPVIFLLADRYPKRRFVVGGLAILGLASIAAGLAPSYAVLFAALSLYGPASGTGVALAQAALADARPRDLERALVRWTFAGALGDLATPSVVALGAYLAAGWRVAFVASGAAFLAWAGALAFVRFPESARASHSAEPEERASLAVALGESLRAPRLLVFAGAVTLCSLMDELPVAFGSLYLADVQSLGLAARTAALTALMVGELTGLAAGDRLVARFAPRALLGASAAGTALAWLAFLTASAPGPLSAALFAAGALASLQYPLVKAQAYRALPGRTGAVNAVLTMFGLVELALPLALGAVADGAGLRAALALLSLQPLALFALAALAPARTFIDPRAADPPR
jgi:predicted MFS family arabinose efflux permease